MCLYGSDLDEDTTPLEAGLGWVIGKGRKESGEFIGAEGVKRQLKEGVPRKRVGLVVQGAPARGMLFHHNIMFLFSFIRLSSVQAVRRYSTPRVSNRSAL